MRSCTALLLAVTFTAALESELRAQSPVPRLPNAIGEIRGILTDSATSARIARGSITVRRADDSSFAGGALPRADGAFRVDGLAPGSYSIVARVLGYRSFTRAFVVRGGTPTVDLGVIPLAPAATTLADQVVLATRDDRALAPDRNTYDTRNMTAAAGGNTLDVLRNIPAVEVDGANRVTLRGSGNVVVQVNGRSTPLAGKQLGSFLAQIPANLIRSVEVATNPSARSDPEGTAGIINIVLDQHVDLGLSGSVTAAASTTSQVNLSGNLGRQRGPLTVFASVNGSRDDRGTSGTISRTNLAITSPARVEARLDGKQTPKSAGGTLRSEYRFNGESSVTVDGYLFGAHYGSDQRSAYTDLDRSGEIVGLFDQSLGQLSRASSQHAVFGVHHQRNGTPMKLDGEAEYWNNHNANEADITGRVTQAGASTPAAIHPEYDRTLANFSYWNLKTDYSETFAAHRKLEAGVRTTQRTTTNYFTATLADGSGALVVDPHRITDLEYTESISSGYIVATQEIGVMQAQGGLRLEDVDTRLTIPTAALQHVGGYRSVFPSAVIAWNIDTARQLRFSYSRRVTRPYPGQLSPVDYYQDSRNLTRGNPMLRPEYTNAMELSLSQARPWGSVQLVPYLRRANHAIRTIQFVDSTGVSVTTVGNVASATTIGSDLNITVRTGSLSFVGGGSTYRYRSDASNLESNLSTRAFVWATRANVTWRFTPRLDVQATGSYRAPYATEGGSTLPSVAVNAGARYRLWGDQGSISIRLSDPFRLARYGYRTATGSVIEYSERYNGTRAVFISVTRSFGQRLRISQQNEQDGA